MNPAVVRTTWSSSTRTFIEEKTGRIRIATPWDKARSRHSTDPQRRRVPGLADESRRLRGHFRLGRAELDDVQRADGLRRRSITASGTTTCSSPAWRSARRGGQEAGREEDRAGRVRARAQGADGHRRPRARRRPGYSAGKLPAADVGADWSPAAASSSIPRATIFPSRCTTRATWCG